MAIRTLGGGEDLGWSWLFPPHYLHFSVQAIEPVRAIFFCGTRLRQQCEEDRKLGFELMKRIAEVLVQNLQATQQCLMQSTPKATPPIAYPVSCGASPQAHRVDEQLPAMQEDDPSRLANK